VVSSGVSDSHYRVGIVGCGNIGGTHAEAYRRHDRLSVTAAADTDRRTREGFAAEYDPDATYGDHTELLADAGVDVVSVCTWHSTHAQIAVDACESGVEGIFLEKPMATSWGETRDILDAADRTDTKVVVGHQRRFHPVNEAARRLVRDGAIGTPLTATARQGGGLLNWGTHMIDMVRYLLGDPDYDWVMGQVERKTDRHERGLPIEDRCLGHICFEDGTRMTYESDMPDPEIAESTIRVTGSEGVLEVHFGSHVRVTNGQGTDERAPAPDRGNRMKFLDEFAEWLDGTRSEHRCSGAKAGEVMQVMMALYESARSRSVVDRPLRTKANPLEVMIEDGDLPVAFPGKYDIRLPYASLRPDE
jgi:predicted dehydrogenase